MDNNSFLQGESAHSPADEGKLDTIEAPTGNDQEFQRLEEDIQQQRWNDALARCHRLLRSGTATAEVHAACGNVLQHLGQYAAAIDAFRSALVIGGETPALHDAAGLCCLTLRDFASAASHFRAALDLQGQQSPVLLLHFGMALLEAGRAEEAELILRRAVQKAPEMAPAHFHLGLCAERRQQPSEALAHYGDAVRRDPRHAEALFRIGHILADMGRMGEATAAYQQILNIRPDDPHALVFIAQIFSARGMLQEAVAHLRKALARNAGHADGWTALGQAQTNLGDMKAAAFSYDCALRAHPGHLATRLGRILLAERQGRDDEVREQVHALLPALPRHPQLLLVLGRLARSREERESALKYLEASLQAEREKLGRDNESILRFAAGALHDKLGRTAEAFGHLSKANNYQRSIKPYRRKQIAGYFARIRDQFSADTLAKLPHSQQPDERPIFLVGMPRSGTSLAEQILASHPDVFGAGELRSLDDLLLAPTRPETLRRSYPDNISTLDIEDMDRLAKAYLRTLPDAAHTALRVTDKMPHNFQYAGLISKLFPRARIIHCTRDPRDIGLSCYFQYFAEGNSFSYDLEDFAHYYRQYRQLMKHWEQLGIDMFELRYEQLVADPETTIRAMLEHCGLEWNSSCLKSHENRRVVHTASYKQVREPVHVRSVGRWEAYQPFLAPLIAGLGEWLNTEPELQSNNQS